MVIDGGLLGEWSCHRDRSSILAKALTTSSSTALDGLMTTSNPWPMSLVHAKAQHLDMSSAALKSNATHHTPLAFTCPDLPQTQSADLKRWRRSDSTCCLGVWIVMASLKSRTGDY